MRLLERLAFRVLGVQGVRTDYTVTTVRVPMRDGVELGADLFLPQREAVGTLLVRGPYGRGWALSLISARMYAARGYRVLYVSSRGTFDSGGAFDPMRDEAADGQDVVAWMRGQPWFTGTFATVGASYLGHTQWALLADPPPELVAAVISVGPHDFSRHAWGTGAFNLDFVGWSDMIVQARKRQPRIPGFSGGRERELKAVTDGLPLADVADAYFQGEAPWFRYRVTHPDLTDPYWAPMQHADALERVTVPVLLISGWQDIFLGQSMEQYRRLRERGVDVALTVGPWTHIDVIAKGARETTPQVMGWLDEHLAGRGEQGRGEQGRGERGRATPVRVFVTGAGEWRDLPDWPPATTEREVRLHGDRWSFDFDPADPTPTVGGPLIAGGGVVDDSALASRNDVLAFTGEALTADLDVLGAPSVELAHSTDNPHADLFVRISDVDPKGVSRNVTEGYLRLDPERGEEPVHLTLLPAAHRFLAGHRVRVLIAGGCHPRFARNLGTGENPGTGTELRSARHTVRPGGAVLRIPVLTGEA
ncbi:CocE/NonD family hydrolase [Actinoplanes sp. NPDC051851]|uniref:CocE/NonD family hydrolase n=1 Tax=Actinoplanes sp. NPDC051851 TaxID=3154753 RepID=UPI00342F8968